MQPNPDYVHTLANGYAACLRLCFPPSGASLPLARAIHANIIASGFRPRAHIVNCLINVYCKSSKLDYARHLFDEIPKPDGIARTTIISGYSNVGNINLACRVFEETPLSMRDTVMYNSMITGFSHHSDGYSALKLFSEMKRDGFRPDNFTFTSVLAGLSLVVEEEKQCLQFHGAVVRSGSGYVTSVSNALVSVYVKCASSPYAAPSSLLGAARKVFDEIPAKDELSWTSMIMGYMKNGFLDLGLELLEGMDDKMQVAWNAMISGHVHRGLYLQALEMVRRMLSSGIELDEFTYTSILSACANGGLLQMGKQMHAYILRKAGRSPQDFLLPIENALVTLYYKCGKVDEARGIFEMMSKRDVVTWNALLSGYVSAGRIGEAKLLFEEMEEKNLVTWTQMISALAQSGAGEEGLKLFSRMKKDGFEPCDYAFAGAITCCAALGLYSTGQQYHAHLIKLGFDVGLSAVNSLITMYARCGCIEDARRVFLTMPYLDSVSWNSMIAALGQHGHGVEAIKVYEEMLKEGLLPDRITFLSVLTACSHAGLVEQGRKYFESMKIQYSIPVGDDHYARVIDMLCRSGKFTEAENVIRSMPFEPTLQIWEALLSGCRNHGNTELGVIAAEKLLNLAPEHDGTYVQLSNIYAAAGQWDEKARVRKLMRDRGVKKEPGRSWIDIGNKVHVFLVDDTKHPEAKAVYNYLEQLGSEMRKHGYVPDTRFVLHDVESENYKEHALSTHSEKLAVTFGLMKLPPEATIRVFKNLRTCGDCHNFFRFLSQVMLREIVVRDSKRFHHFRNGKCSCGDFW